MSLALVQWCAEAAVLVLRGYKLFNHLSIEFTDSSTQKEKLCFGFLRGSVFFFFFPAYLKVRELMLSKEVCPAFLELF